MLNRTALGAIWVYQTYVSPRKGFRCAYSAVHGGTGCSGYVKHTIREDGIWDGWPKIRQRFADCKAAYASLRSSGPAGDADNGSARKKNSGRWCDRANCACDTSSFACGAAKAGATKKGGLLDLNPCDGDCGVGGCSCDVCSCN